MIFFQKKICVKTILHRAYTVFHDLACCIRVSFKGSIRNDNGNMPDSSTVH